MIQEQKIYMHDVSSNYMRRSLQILRILDVKSRVFSSKTCI